MAKATISTQLLCGKGHHIHPTAVWQRPSYPPNCFVAKAIISTQLLCGKGHHIHPTAVWQRSSYPPNCCVVKLKHTIYLMYHIPSYLSSAYNQICCNHKSVWCICCCTLSMSIPFYCKRFPLLSKICKCMCCVIHVLCDTCVVWLATTVEKSLLVV